MKIVFFKINDVSAGLVLNECFIYLPLFRNRPIKRLCSGRNFKNIQIFRILFKDFKSLSYPFTRKASAYRKYFFGNIINLLSVTHTVPSLLCLRHRSGFIIRHFMIFVINKSPESFCRNFRIPCAFHGLICPCSYLISDIPLIGKCQDLI